MAEEEETGAVMEGGADGEEAGAIDETDTGEIDESFMSACWHSIKFVGSSNRKRAATGKKMSDKINKFRRRKKKKESKDKKKRRRSSRSESRVAPRRL